MNEQRGSKESKLFSTSLLKFGIKEFLRVKMGL